MSVSLNHLEIMLQSRSMLSLNFVYQSRADTFC